eukprot:CAMPEP_0115661490 /NCGR_PEP_ID=MMETSP0272-20121206/46815_1 /TAXON_ID=71861 /ORGANISM="Scrippsiella trochoidea, Strain CCMP3099" /LENGTH=80 /DNA_ID=CAMNT_0003099735 /DNA_START=168 /DNA_END=410 /DNA_ORIENTATION=-
MSMSVVFPDPDGPMTAARVPVSKCPDTGSRIVLSFSPRRPGTEKATSLNVNTDSRLPRSSSEPSSLLPAAQKTSSEPVVK